MSHVEDESYHMCNVASTIVIFGFSYGLLHLPNKHACGGREADAVEIPRKVISSVGGFLSSTPSHFYGRGRGGVNLRNLLDFESLTLDK